MTTDGKKYAVFLRVGWLLKTLWFMEEQQMNLCLWNKNIRNYYKTTDNKKEKNVK